jgi:carbon-monoxide dehydrogenase small subunit
MSKVSIEINGRQFEREVVPRTHLGDFLRDEIRLTGTHLGCEHGVCGACTVLLDGKPVRSCITFAVACDGARITTVEGYDADPVMARLRPAFSRHHALQCGFCTPGMLATARDIVLRLPDADEERIRIELSGNLCRCTGYMGIVAAVGSVLQDLRKDPVPEVEALRRAAQDGTAIVPMPSSAVQPDGTASTSFTGFTAAGASVATPARAGAVSLPARGEEASAAETGDARIARSGKGQHIDGSFDVPFPAEQVWALMVDLPAVAACLPGASVTSMEGDRVKGKVAVKFGPMSAAFNGAARLERDDDAQSATLRGAGQDTLSQSRATGDIGYRLESLSADATRVHIDMRYGLQGPLAQFSRSGLVRDFVRRMIAEFGRNVTARLGAPVDAPAPPPASAAPARMLLALLWDRVRRILGGGR